MSQEEKTLFLSRCECRWHSLGSGNWLVACHHEAYMGPIGFVWGVFPTNNNFYVAGSYVRHDCQRRGIRTFINKHLLEWYPIISTGQGSDKGGKQFLLASNYKYNKLLDQWFLVKKGYKPKPSDQNAKILAQAKGVGKGRTKRHPRKQAKNRG